VEVARKEKTSDTGVCLEEGSEHWTPPKASQKYRSNLDSHHHRHHYRYKKYQHAACLSWASTGKQCSSSLLLTLSVPGAGYLGPALLSAEKLPAQGQR